MAPEAYCILDEAGAKPAVFHWVMTGKRGSSITLLGARTGRRGRMPLEMGSGLQGRMSVPTCLGKAGGDMVVDTGYSRR